MSLSLLGMFKAVRHAVGWRKTYKAQGQPQSSNGSVTNNDVDPDLQHYLETKQPSQTSPAGDLPVFVGDSVNIQIFESTCSDCKNNEKIEIPFNDIATCEYKCANCDSVQRFRENSSVKLPSSPNQAKEMLVFLFLSESTCECNLLMTLSFISCTSIAAP